jgi:tRNA A37 threonylcarbamoyladenosine synthetase subunit TsaC/SUA5/YrdC
VITIKNTQARIIGLRWPAKDGRVAGSLDLVPGDNHVAEEVASSAMDTSGFRMFARTGVLRVRGAKAAAAVAPVASAVVDIKTMTAKQAVTHVGTVSDVALLDSWLGTEERSTVVAAIAARIEVLRPTPADVDSDDDNDDA